MGEISTEAISMVKIKIINIIISLIISLIKIKNHIKKGILINFYNYSYEYEDSGYNKKKFGGYDKYEKKEYTFEKTKSSEEFNIKNTNKEYEIKPTVVTKTYSGNPSTTTPSAEVPSFREGAWRRASPNTY